jgi:predicted 3-demethylubiquinone-9 3-methyltransferase (glyoxalase superfamily)
MKTWLLLAALLLPALPAEVSDMPAAPKTPKITPFLWFEDDAEEAIRFYTSLFPESEVLGETRWGPGGPVPAGSLMSARFRLAGQEFMALNGGPTYRLNPAYSMFVNCESQTEIDRLWDALVAGGGQPSMCGWLVDRFGVSWQLVPPGLDAMLTDEDPARAARVTKAMLGMQKLDLAALQAAYAGR